MTVNMLTSLSPLDGRYAEQTQGLQPYFSEYALMRHRLIIEIRFLQALSQEPRVPELSELSDTDHEFLDNLITQFDLIQANQIKTIEKTTNHDVKAIEYYLQSTLKNHPNINPNFIHFACTSEDINNLAYGLMIQSAKQDVIIPQIEKLIDSINCFSKKYSTLAMLSRTHGQAATPTTLGKEFKNIHMRLSRQLDSLKKTDVLGKFNGAVGNFNAQVFAYPEVDWRSFSKQFILNLGLSPNEYTTQIEPHDNLAEIFHNMMRINTILIDFSRDIWGYISLSYLGQKAIPGEVGSSTMPHKINPIDFENAEGNLGLANALFGHMSAKLPCSRWQRDLSDSTVLRNIGVAFGHMLIAVHSLQKGLDKLNVNLINEQIIQNDLNNHWEVLGEAVQTVMRRYGLSEPYEKLKAFTRGKKIDQASLQLFIEALDLPEAEKLRLRALTPASYIGLASVLAAE